MKETQLVPKKNKADKGLVAYKLLEQIRLMLRTHNILFFEIGKALKTMRDSDLYKALGDGGYDTWASFLSSEELGVKESTAQAYISLYEFWIIDRLYTMEQVAEVPYDKLRTILPLARKTENKEDLDELFYKAKALSRSDLLIEIGKADPISGKLKQRLISVSLCDNCGNYRMPEDVILCQCKEVKPK